MGASLQRNKRHVVAEMNVVPYIDVMLVLLVIFMVTAPLLSQGVQVNLPKASAHVIDAQKSEPIVVSVDAAGRFYLNIAAIPSQAISEEEILQHVAAQLAVAKERGEVRQVLVKGDQAVDYGKVMAAMVCLQRAGAENVGLVTDPSVS